MKEIGEEVDEDVFDNEPEPELEFMTLTIEFARERLGMNEEDIEKFLADGWDIHHSISCPPYAMIIFSRPKEEESE